MLWFTGASFVEGRLYASTGRHSKMVMDESLIADLQWDLALNYITDSSVLKPLAVKFLREVDALHADLCCVECTRNPVSA